MDKSHILSGTDGRFWSYGCPILIVRQGVGKGTQNKMATTDNLLLVLFLVTRNFRQFAICDKNWREILINQFSVRMS